MLTPMGLAIWYLDDGCYNKGNRTVMISTYREAHRLKMQRYRASLRHKRDIARAATHLSA